MTKILNNDLSKIVFNGNVTKDSIYKYNDGDLFGLRVNSYSAVYPIITGNSGNLECKMKISTVGKFEEPAYMLYKKINSNIALDIITGKMVYIIADKEDMINTLKNLNVIDSNINGLAKYYYLVDKELKKEIPIITINLKENVVDIAEDYKINPEKTFIDAIDSYKLVVANETLPKSDHLKEVQEIIENNVLDTIRDQYKNSIEEAYDLAQMDNIIYDVEKKNKM